MARTIYEKPARILLKEMLDAWRLNQGETFDTARAVKWFAKSYPKFAPSNVSAHLVQAATNDPNRLRHATTIADDLLSKVGPGKYRLYDQARDPAPLHKTLAGSADTSVLNAGSAVSSRNIVELIRSQQRRLVYDMVREAEVDVSDWATSRAKGSSPASNPKYC